MYKYNYTSRTFLLGLDYKDYSQYALEWGMQELFEDNDEIVILRVIDSGMKDSVSFRSIRGLILIDSGESSTRIRG